MTSRRRAAPAAGAAGPPPRPVVTAAAVAELAAPLEQARRALAVRAGRALHAMLAQALREAVEGRRWEN